MSTDASSSTETKAAKKGKAAEPKKSLDQVIHEDVIPATIKAFQDRNVNDLQLKWEGKTLIGSFDNGRKVFNVLLTGDDLKGPKFFACSSDNSPASTVESFMIDERKIDPPLLVFYIVQRIYAQQWF